MAKATNREIMNYVGSEGQWLGFPAVWLSNAGTPMMRSVDDRGVLRAFTALARPEASLKDLTRFIQRHGWLPLSARREAPLHFGGFHLISPRGDEPAPDDIAKPGLTAKMVCYSLSPAADGSGRSDAHPLPVYQQYAQIASYILQANKAVREYEAKRERVTWAATAEKYGLDQLCDAVATTGAPIISTAAATSRKVREPVRLARHASYYALRWWFRIGRLQVEPTLAKDGRLHLSVSADDLWGVLALQLGQTVAGGRYDFCRNCGLFFLRASSGGNKGGRPVTLCPECYTPEEGRRLAARIAYDKQRDDRGE